MSEIIGSVDELRAPYQRKALGALREATQGPTGGLTGTIVREFFHPWNGFVFEIDTRVGKFIAKVPIDPEKKIPREMHGLELLSHVSGLNVVSPFAVVNGVLLERKLPGVNLDDLDPDSPELIAALPAVMRNLAVLHSDRSIPVDGIEREFVKSNFGVRSRGWVDDFTEHLAEHEDFGTPGQRSAWQKTLQRLDRDIDRISANVHIDDGVGDIPLHGDLQRDNVLVDGDESTLIDVGDMNIGPVWWELAHFTWGMKQQTADEVLGTYVREMRSRNPPELAGVDDAEIHLAFQSARMYDAMMRTSFHIWAQQFDEEYFLDATAKSLDVVVDLERSVQQEMTAFARGGVNLDITGNSSLADGAAV